MKFTVPEPRKVDPSQAGIGYWEMQDRGILPSASSLPRYALCPGSFRLCKGLPELKTPEMAEWGRSGDRVHSFLSGKQIDLNPGEVRVATLCLEARDKLVDQVLPEFSTSEVMPLLEQRLWLYRRDAEGYPTPERRFSGQLDFAAASKDRKTALVVDYKTNRGEQDDSDNSLQLRSEGVLLWLHLKQEPDKIYVAMVQPLAGKPVLCEYDRASLEQSLRQIESILDLIESPDAPLCASKAACKHCNARLQCPVAWKEVESLVGANPAFLDGARLSQMLDRWQVAKEVGKLLEAKSKEMIAEDPESVPNWGLKSGGSIRSVSDAYALCRLLVKAKLVKSPKEFVQKFCGVNIGDLEGHLGPEAVTEVCGEAIVRTPKEGSLKRL